MGDLQYLNKGLQEVTVKRSEVSFNEPFEKVDEFLLGRGQRKYNQQFFSMYQHRFNTLSERVLRNAIKKWGDGTKKIDGQTIFRQDKILDITSGKLCWVIGTIFCDAKNKLNILQDVEKGTDDILPEIPASYLDDDEEAVVMLEDESGRAVLHNQGFLDNNLLVTGCIVGVLGIELQAGIFEIMDVVYPTIAPQKALPQGNSTKTVALISGLNIGKEGINDLRMELLKQYLIGEVGLNEDAMYSGTIAELIIAGDSILPLSELGGANDSQSFITSNNYGSKNISKYNAESLRKLDEFVNDVILSLPVSVMPGHNDPAEICLPQQALHKAMFKNSTSVLGDSRLQRLTNPQWFEIDGVRILGTSGQNIDDVKKYTKKSLSAISIMRANLHWQNFIPTAPDTLYCYPFEECDPFTFNNEIPHVYFVANQGKYESEEFQLGDNCSVRLVSIPKFSETGEFVVLNLETLSCNVVRIDI